MKQLVCLFTLFLFLPACSPEMVYNLNVSEYELHFDAAGGEHEVTVTSDRLPITIEDCPEWITVTEKGETGKNKLLLLFTASENDSESAREYIISVAELFPEGGSHTMGITVRQDGGIN